MITRPVWSLALAALMGFDEERRIRGVQVCATGRRLRRPYPYWAGPRYVRTCHKCGRTDGGLKPSDWQWPHRIPYEDARQAQRDAGTPPLDGCRHH